MRIDLVGTMVCVCVIEDFVVAATACDACIETEWWMFDFFAALHSRTTNTHTPLCAVLCSVFWFRYFCRYCCCLTLWVEECSQLVPPKLLSCLICCCCYRFFLLSLSLPLFVEIGNFEYNSKSLVIRINGQGCYRHASGATPERVRPACTVYMWHIY